MTQDRNKNLEALQVAIQMEIDGKEYYLKQSDSSSNQPGRELFRSLAQEEDIHRQKFEQIYQTISSKQAWPQVSLEPAKGKKMKTIFATAAERLGLPGAASDSELNAVKTAMDMENESYDLYQSRSETAAYDTEREFYQALAAEEREHYLSLLDYYEYLKDPAAWFVSQEHPSLDGG